MYRPSRSFGSSAPTLLPLRVPRVEELTEAEIPILHCGCCMMLSEHPRNQPLTDCLFRGRKIRSRDCDYMPVITIRHLEPAGRLLASELLRKWRKYSALEKTTTQT